MNVSSRVGGCYQGFPFRLSEAHKNPEISPDPLSHSTKEETNPEKPLRGQGQQQGALALRQPAAIQKGEWPMKTRPPLTHLPAGSLLEAPTLLLTGPRGSTGISIVAPSTPPPPFDEEGQAVFPEAGLRGHVTVSTAQAHPYPLLN